MKMNDKMQEMMQGLDGTEAPIEVSTGDSKRIYNYCVHLLARQDYSEFKLRQKLRSKPQNLPQDIDEAVSRLKGNGLLREENYRRLFIRKWMQKGESEDKIRKRGAQEKITFSREEFEQAAKELGFDDEDSLERLVMKKLRSREIPSDPKERFKLKTRILRFLISKGHDYDSAKRGLAPYFDL